MSNVLASQGGPCGRITSPCLGEGHWEWSHSTPPLTTDHMIFCPVIAETEDWLVAMCLGVWLYVRLPSGLFKAWVHPKRCTTCLSSILQVSKPSSRWFPGAACSLCCHFVGIAFLAWNCGSFKNSSLCFAVDSWHKFFAAQFVCTIRCASRFTLRWRQGLKDRELLGRH